jgi:hypothetical protein
MGTLLLALRLFIIAHVLLAVGAAGTADVRTG